MEIFKIKIGILSESVSEVSYGTKEYIETKLIHLLKNAENRESKLRTLLINLEHNHCNLSTNITIGKTILSIDVSDIELLQESIPSAYTNATKHGLITIFPEDYLALRDIINFELNELEYSDNYRICLKGDSEGEKLYEEAYNNGCCGFFDKEYEINGKVYKIGCNYGH